MLLMAGGARLRSIQRGETVLASGTEEISITLAPVDLSRSFVILELRSDTTESGSYYVSGTLVNSTTLQLRRERSNGSVSVVWQVVEFRTGITVQMVTGAGSSTTNLNLPITPVDVDKTFLLVNMRVQAIADLGACRAIARFATGRNDLVQVVRSSSTGTMYPVVYVVEVD